MSPTDFIVHINETLDQPALEAMEEEIRHGQGVVSASHRSGKPHLIQVVYDSDATKMSDIVQDVREHGVHAQGVGL